jgi:predicted outer membrane repeat protein
MDSRTRSTGLAAAAAALACTLGLAASAHAATTYTVTAGDVSSLESAITQANGDGVDSIVNVPAGTYGLDGNGLDIANDGTFTLAGAGARSTIFDGTTPPGDGSPMFTIGGGAVATISGVTFENASVDGDGGAINVSGPSNPASLAVTDSAFANNETAFSGESGGAIFNAGNLDVERDTFSNNRSATDGSAIASQPFAIGAPVRGLIGGNVTIVNTTFNGNTSGEDGQGTGEGTIYLAGNTVDLVNDTIAGNGDLNSDGNGGLFVEIGQANVVNTIIAGNTAGTGASATETNCGIGKAVISSQGHNIESGVDCGFKSAGDQQNTDPILGSLQDNGGQMDTMALLAGSPAIDKADSANCPATDEIGTTRPQGPGCDIGAYEVPLPPPAQPQPPAQPVPPLPAPAQPAAPKVSVAGVRRACVSHSFHLRIHVATTASVKSVKVRLDGRTIRSTTRRMFTLTINSRRLKAGRHHVTITATDSNGKVTTSRRTFSICQAAKPRHHAAPRFTG